MKPDSKIFVAGHRGMVGSAIVRRLEADGSSNLLLRTRSELDLTDQAAVERFFAAEKPEYVFLAAARVGGIHANDTYPAEFIHSNLSIQTNVIHSAWKHGTTKLCFLGSSCVYPKLAPQPLQEDSLLTGPLEPTNEWYAVAKIAGIKMCQAYRRQYGFDAISLMPTNLYGPGDNFHLENSHVMPAMIRRFHEAKTRGDASVTIWGTGTPRREFLHVDDMADAAVFLMRNYSGEAIVNVGSPSRRERLDALRQIVRDGSGERGLRRIQPARARGPAEPAIQDGSIRRRCVCRRSAGRAGVRPRGLSPIQADLTNGGRHDGTRRLELSKVTVPLPQLARSSTFVVRPNALFEWASPVPDE